MGKRGSAYWVSVVEREDKGPLGALGLVCALHLTTSGMGQMLGCCEHGHELSGYRSMEFVISHEKDLSPTFQPSRLLTSPG